MIDSVNIDYLIPITYLRWSNCNNNTIKRTSREILIALKNQFEYQALDRLKFKHRLYSS